MKRRDVGISLITLGLGWLVIGYFIYSFFVPLDGRGSIPGLLWIIIPPAILLILGILLLADNIFLFWQWYGGGSTISFEEFKKKQLKT